jgi:hypothetical protein
MGKVKVISDGSERNVDWLFQALFFSEPSAIHYLLSTGLTGPHSSSHFTRPVNCMTVNRVIIRAMVMTRPVNPSKKKQ